jgi:SAM-dependent methyltransferase
VRSGIDLSQSSLAHETFLKEKYRLDNLQLHCLDILDVGRLGRPFDLIVSTGVLHHLPDPDAGLRRLKTVLSPKGVMSIMVYGWYRRFGVYMMQEAFRLLGVEQTAEGVALVRETLAALPAWHHVQCYANSAPDLSFDGGIVDTFLHTTDRAYSVAQVLRFASDNGLRFQDWLDRHNYSVSCLIPRDVSIHPLAVRLSAEDRWQLVELLGQSLGSHRFLLCHPERDPDDFTIDFSGPEEHGAWLSYIPQPRPFIEVVRLTDPLRGTPAVLRRLEKEFTIEVREAPLFEAVNGQSTIAQIIDQRSATADQRAENRRTAHRLFARLYDQDHLLYQIGSRPLP